MTAYVPTLQVHGRPLVDVARPAAGRRHQHQVGMASVGCWLVDPARHQLAEALARATGPTRCSAIAVEALWSVDEVLVALRRPPFADLSVERITIALAGYDAALAAFGHAAFLLAYCCVLWPQTETSPRWNTS